MLSISILLRFWRRGELQHFSTCWDLILRRHGGPDPLWVWRFLVSDIFRFKLLRRIKLMVTCCCRRLINKFPHHLSFEGIHRPLHTCLWFYYEGWKCVVELFYQSTSKLYGYKDEGATPKDEKDSFFGKFLHSCGLLAEIGSRKVLCCIKYWFSIQFYYLVKTLYYFPIQTQQIMTLQAWKWMFPIFCNLQNRKAICIQFALQK